MIAIRCNVTQNEWGLFHSRNKGLFAGIRNMYIWTPHVGYVWQVTFQKASTWKGAGHTQNRGRHVEEGFRNPAQTHRHEVPFALAHSRTGSLPSVRTVIEGGFTCVHGPHTLIEGGRSRGGPVTYGDYWLSQDIPSILPALQ